MSAYGCHGKPRPSAQSQHLAQSGYSDGWRPEFAAVSRTPIWVKVPHVMTTDCQYTKMHASDPECSGCVHRAKDAA
jgi:hypothetical protein